MTNVEYIVIEKHSVWVPGDERSRTHPGHGYPAHYEDTEYVTRCKDMRELESCVLAKGEKELEIYRVQRVNLVKHVSLQLSYPE